MVLFEGIEEIWNQVRDFNEYSRALVTLATSIGAIIIFFYTLKLAYKLSLAIRLYCLSQCRCLCQQSYREKYGQWAVISGSTDGIGLAMARDLARRGMSIIVIGRNEDKLANAKTSLEQELNAGEIMTVKIDLSDSSLDNFARIRSQIDPENRDIGILINNAGSMPSKFRRFNRHDSEGLKDIVNLNILATLYLTRMIMPGMLDRGKGLVVNVSSTLGCIPTPYASVYGATKSFIDAFSRQLQIEYSDHPVKIVNLTPGAVHTKLFTSSSTLPEPSIINPSPEDYARTSLNALSTGISQYSGTAFHGFGRELGLFLDSIGLVPFLFRANLKMNARDVELSPVPRRKRPNKVSDLGAASAGDGAQTNLPTK